MPCYVHDWSVAENDTPISDETSITDLPVRGRYRPACRADTCASGPTGRPIGKLARRRRWPSGWCTPSPSTPGRGVLPEPLGHSPTHRPTVRRRAVTGPRARRTRRRRQQYRHVRVVHLRPRRPGTGVRAHRPTSTTHRRVDLAGQGRGLNGHAVLDPFAGGLHLLASTSRRRPVLRHRLSGGLTRTSRFIEDAPSHLHDLRLTRHHVVLLADGFIGISDRAGANIEPAGWRSTSMPDT